MVRKILLASIITALFLSACKKETEDFKTAAINEYAPMQVGKYITYRLDSFKYLPQSIGSIITTYQVKYFVDAEIIDNLGRPAYRIIRYIRSNSTAAWVSDNTFSAVNTGTSFEFLENNLRFLKLKQPITEGYTWKGNAYILSTSVDQPDIRFYDDWDYMYDSVNAPLTLGSITLDSTIKVNQRDDIVGNPDDPNSYSERNFGVEYYAKGIGLVYKKFLHSEYQPPTTSGSNGTYSDFTKGITLTMIDHN